MELTRSDILSAYRAALKAVDPVSSVTRAVSFDGERLTVGGHEFVGAGSDDMVVVALGKAAGSMAAGFHEVTQASRGLVVAPSVVDTPYDLCVGSHPIPDAGSLRCGEAIFEFVSSTLATDLVVFLISGGGSATATLPVDGLLIEDIAEMNRQLVMSGLPIESVNEVRSAVSRIKGGRLAVATRAERQVTLILSDVVGGHPKHVASGPTIGHGLGTGARTVIDAYGLRDRLPGTVIDAVDRSIEIAAPNESWYKVVGSSEIAAEAAVSHLRSLGLSVSLVPSSLEGDARAAAVALLDAANPEEVLVAAGETTVTVEGRGVGGRNQEAALALAIAAADRDVLFGALGTDGIDGPTKAAGAIVDGCTSQRAHDRGIDLGAALRDNDSHTALSALGETVVTGPTGTNVADLWILSKGSN